MTPHDYLNGASEYEGLTGTFGDDLTHPEPTAGDLLTPTYRKPETSGELGPRRATPPSAPPLHPGCALAVAVVIVVSLIAVSRADTRIHSAAKSIVAGTPEVGRDR